MRLFTRSILYLYISFIWKHLLLCIYTSHSYGSIFFCVCLTLAVTMAKLPKPFTLFRAHSNIMSFATSVDIMHFAIIRFIIKSKKSGMVLYSEKLMYRVTIYYLILIVNISIGSCHLKKLISL